MTSVDAVWPHEPGPRATGNPNAGCLANHRSNPIDFIKRSAAQPHETTPMISSPL